MKKLVLVFAVLFACSLFSCNNNTESEKTLGACADTTVVADSDTVVTVDSVAVDSATAKK